MIVAGMVVAALAMGRGAGKNVMLCCTTVSNVDVFVSDAHGGWIGKRVRFLLMY